MKRKTGIGNRLTVWAIALIVLLAVAFSATVLFAYFSADREVGADVNTPANVGVDVTLGAHQTAPFAFASAGDEYAAELTVSNPNVFAISYKIRISGVRNNALRDALIAKLDGKTLGILSKLPSDADGSFTLPDEFLLAPATSAGAADRRTHTLSLELHVGAGNLFADVLSDVKIEVAAVAYNEADTLFVRGAEEFVQAIRPETLTGASVRTIYLVDSVDLAAYQGNVSTGGAPAAAASDVVLSSAVAIDLNGKTLALNTGLFFRYSGTETGAVVSSTPGGAVTFAQSASGNGIVIDTPNAYVEFGQNGKNAGNFTAPAPSVQSIDPFKLASAAKNYAENALAGGVSKTAADFLGGYGFYVAAGAVDPGFPAAPAGLLTFETAGANASVRVADGAGDFLPETLSVSFRIRVTAGILAEESVSVGLLTGENLADAILKENNAYLYPPENAPADYRAVVSRDLYLPTRVRVCNARIEWFSSDPNALTDSGKYRPDMEAREVELTAVVSFEGVRYVRKFRLTVSGFTAAERLALLAAAESVVFVKSPDVYVFGFDASFYRLENVRFEVSQADAAFLEVGTETVSGASKDALRLKASPADSWTTEITVFANGIGETERAEAKLNVTVRIERSVSVVDEAQRYAENFLPAGNTFTDFALPTDYNGVVSISYEVKNGSFIENGNSYKNAENVRDYVSVAPSADVSVRNAVVAIDAEKVPVDNSEVFLVASLTYNGTTERRVLSFSLAGILHNNEREIADYALYVKLLNKTDENGDFYITRDEADRASIAELSLSKSGISDLKGIEYFRLTGSLDLSYNRLYSVGALGGMRELKSLNLAYNNLSSASALAACVSLTSLDLSNNKNLADVTAISGLGGITELKIHNDSGQGALSDISSIREMTGLKTLTVYNTGVSSVLNNNLNAILTAYFSYYDRFGKYPDYYIAGRSTRFSVAEANVAAYRAKNAAINAIEPIYEFANVVYLPPVSGGYAVEWSSYPAEIIEIAGDRAYVRQPLADVDATLTAEIDVGISSHRILRSFPVISRGAGTYSVQTEDGGAPLDAATVIPDPNLRYLLFREFDADGNGSITYSELIRSVDNVLSFDRQNLTSLAGIQYFSGITGLNLSGNPFSDLTPLNALSLTTLILQNSSADLTKLEPKTPGQTGESAWKYTTVDVYGSAGLADSAVTAQLLHLYNNHLTEAGKIFKDEKNPNGEWKPYEDELKRVATNFWGTLAIGPGEQFDLPTKYTWLTENDVSIGYVGQGGAQNQIKITFGDVRENGVIVAKRLSLTYENAPAVDTNVFAKVKVTYTVPESGKTYSVEVLKSVWLLTDPDLKIEMPDGSTALLSAAVTDSAARKTLINAFGQAARAAGNHLITRKMMTDAAFDTVSFTSDSAEGLEGLKVFEGIGIRNLTVSFGADAYRIRNADGTTAVKKLLAPVSAVADTLETLTIGNSFADLTALPELPALTKLTLRNCPRIVMSEGGRNVFDQSVTGAVLPGLTDLSLSDNYITSPSALTGLRKVTKLTLYNNPCSKTPLTETVVGTVYGYLSDSDKAASQFYIANPKTRWTPGGTLASTVTDAGATLNGTTALRPEIHGVNFVRDGDAPTFPASVTFNGNVFQIDWRTEFTETISNLAAAPLFVNKTGMTAYVSAEAYFPEISKSIFYYFAVEGSGTDRAPYVNFDLFETTVGAETALADPYFAYYCFDALKRADPENRSGIYRKEIAESVTALDFGNTISERNYAVSKLNGIENFTALQSFNVDYNAVRDLTPVKDLAELRSLEAKGNEITSLWLSDGVTSVFKNLTKLGLLKLGYNNNVEDYKPVVYAGFSDGSGTLRTGLENLKSLFLIDVSTNMSAWNNVTLNGSDFVKTLSVWLEAVRAAGDYAGVSMFLVDGAYRAVVTGREALSRYKGSLDVILNDIPDEYIVKKDSENNFAATNIVRTITRGGIVYTVDYEAYSAAKGDFIKVSSDRISLQNVANLGVGVKLSVLAKVYGEASDIKFYKEIILDASVVNDSIPRIELTEGEKAAYLGAGRGIADADFIALSDGNFTIAAEKLIPDAALLRFLFATYDNDQNKTLSVAERAAVTSIRPENEGIKRIEGLELFPNVSNWFFYRSHIERIPDFVRLPYPSVVSGLEVTFQEEDYLIDISGLLTLTDLSGALRVTSFSVQSCGAFGQQNASVLGALPLTSLSLTATGIYDFSFLFDLTDTLATLKINDFNRTDHNYPGFYDFYDFRDTVVRFLFEAANPIPLYTENSSTHVYENKIETIGWDDNYLYPYLPDLLNLKKGDTKTLASEVSAFGKTYGVRYELVPDGVTDQKKKITLTGGRITIPFAYPNDYFTLKAIRGAYSEEIAVYFAASDEGTADNLADDGLIYDSAAGTRRLSDIFPDIGLRIVLLALFDKNGDGTIALDELNKIPSTVELGLPSSGYYSTVTPVAISSFEGIGYFNPYFKGTLKITGANTADLSPLGALENVKTIDFNAVNYIFRQNDKSTPDHSNITDWGFLAGMKSLTTIFIMHTNSTATGLESIADSKSLTVISSNNSASFLDYSTVSNAIAYAQSRNNLSDYPFGNVTGGSCADEKKAAIILSALAIGDLMKTVGAAGEERKSQIFLKDQTAGAVLTLPTEITYQSEKYTVEYVAASSNVTVLGNTVTALGYENNRKARFVARIRMDGALYERLLEFEVAP